MTTSKQKSLPPELYNVIGKFLPWREMIRLRSVSRGSRIAMEEKPALSMPDFQQAMALWFDKWKQSPSKPRAPFLLEPGEAGKTPSLYLAIVKKFLNDTQAQLQNGGVNSSHELRIGPFLEMIGGRELLNSILSNLFEGGGALDSLDVAAFGGHAPAVSRLLERSRYTERDIEQSLKLAVFSESMDVIRLLLPDPGRAELAAVKHRFLIFAGKMGSARIITELYSSYDLVEGHSNDSYLMVGVIEGSNKNGMEILLENPNCVLATQYRSAIQLACFVGNPEIVKVLLADPRVNAGGHDNACLKVAIEQGHNSVVELLVKHPSIDLNLSNNREFWFAVSLGKKDTAEMICQASSNNRILRYQGQFSFFMQGLFPALRKGR